MSPYQEKTGILKCPLVATHSPKKACMFPQIILFSGGKAREVSLEVFSNCINVKEILNFKYGIQQKTPHEISSLPTKLLG